MQLNKKLNFLVMIVVIASVFSAGCLGGGSGDDDGGGGGGTHVELTPMTATMAPIGPVWMQGTSEQAEETIPVDFGVQKVVQVKFTISVKDSDGEHAETDEGSDPDEITVKITWGNTTVKQKMVTPANFIMQIPESGQAPEGQYLPGSGAINIDANLNGGKTAYFLGFIVWVDQGCEYSITGECTYMAESNL
jgi:hypothetical protein